MKYEVWMEGYLATGMEGIPQGATLVGEVEADSFKDACDLFYGNDTFHYNPQRLTYWGCKLFDNEQDARKNFG